MLHQLLVSIFFYTLSEEGDLNLNILDGRKQTKIINFPQAHSILFGLTNIVVIYKGYTISDKIYTVCI